MFQTTQLAARPVLAVQARRQQGHVIADNDADSPVQSIYTDAVAELVAIGAAIAANCDPCFKYHFQQARKLGMSREDMMLAVKTAQSVKETPAKAMVQLAHRYLEGDLLGLPIVQSCCG